MTYDFKATARKICPSHIEGLGASPIYCCCKGIEQALREAAAAAVDDSLLHIDAMAKKVWGLGRHQSICQGEYGCLDDVEVWLKAKAASLREGGKE